MATKKGFDVSNTTVYAKDGVKMRDVDVAALCCSICLLVLRCPVQVISCGHRFCKDCLESAIISNGLKCLIDGESFTRAEIRVDRGCQKEINSLIVDCPKRCGWKGLLSEMERHIADACSNALKLCQLGCGATILNSKRAAHALECPKRIILCTFCNAETVFDRLEGHYSSCMLYPVTCEYCGEQITTRKEVSQHLQEVCVKYVMGCPMQTETSCSFKGKREEMIQHIMQKHGVVAFGNISTLQTQMEKSNKKVDKLQTLVEQKDTKIQEQSSTIQLLSARLSKLEEMFRSFTCGDSVEADCGVTARGKSSLNSSTLRATEGAAVPRRVSELVDVHESQISQLGDSFRALQESVTQHSITIDDLRLRQDIFDVKTTNGIFIWKIPDVRRRYRDAVERRTISLYSPPFLTSPHGYKMCTRAYLNGDGAGKGTHISLFFVLMRSEHDSLLSWPFKQTVRFTLINQAKQAASITEVFSPDLQSPSFQRPESEMNIASGFPKFARQSVLLDESFTKENALYIKAEVDLSGLVLH